MMQSDNEATANSAPVLIAETGIFRQQAWRKVFLIPRGSRAFWRTAIS
jgi:hypothetical protein